MARKKDEGSVGGSGRLTPVDVQQIQFRRALRGYDEQEVDDFLDRITEELTLLIDERRSATERAGSLPTVRVASAGDAAAASKQAEDLVREARERADAIVRDANQRAAATVREAEARAGAPGAAAAAGAGIGVGAFLTKEREFLQRLAALVQGHAEGVKSMVAASRDPAAGGAGVGGASAAPSGGATSGPAAGPGPADAGPASSPLPDSTSGGPGPGGAGGSGGSGGAAPGSPSASSGAGPGPASAAGGTAAIATATREADEPTVIPEEDRSQAAPSRGTTDGGGPPQQAPQPSRPIEGSGAGERPATGAVTTPEASSDPTGSPAAEASHGPSGEGEPAEGDSTLRELFWGDE